MKNNWPQKLILIALALLPLAPSIAALLLIIITVYSYRHHWLTIRRDRINQIWLLFALWLMLTSILAHDPPEAFLGLANYLPFILIFAGLRPLIDRALLMPLAWAIVLSTVPVLILGLGQLYLGWQTPYLLDWELMAGGNPPGRMASTFMYANSLGFYLVMALAIGLGLWCTLPLQNILPITPPHQPKLKLPSKLWPWLGLTLINLGVLAGIFLTDSRNCWAIAGLLLVGVCLYQSWWWIVAFMGSMVAAIGWSAYGVGHTRDLARQVVPDRLWQRLSDQLYPDRPLATLRSTQWQFSLDLTTQHPWHGWGLRNFSPLYQATYGIWLGHPHNLFVMVALETGLIGLGLMLLAVGLILARAMHRYHQWPEQSRSQTLMVAYGASFIACSLTNLLDVSLFDLRVNLLTWIVLAILCHGGPTNLDQPSEV